jgi:SPP1 family predicted phage head-tail adaptor
VATMDPGKLNRRVQIQQRTAGTDSIGQPNTTFGKIADEWVRIIPRSGSEAVLANARTSTVPVTVRMRYRSYISAGMRIVEGTTVYEILAVPPRDSGWQFMDLQCEVIS